jgi:glucose/arabinose dehydrogenase
MPAKTNGVPGRTASLHHHWGAEPDARHCCLARKLRRSTESVPPSHLVDRFARFLLAIGFVATASGGTLGVTPVRADVAVQVPDAQTQTRFAFASQVVSPAGYGVDVVATGLTDPIAVAFGALGEMYVGEAGRHIEDADPDLAPPARVLQVFPNGTSRVVFDYNVPVAHIRAAPTDLHIPEGLIPPITGLTWHNGLLYVTHRTRVSVLNPYTGAFRTIVWGLPSWGGHHNSQVIFGSDGKMYFAVGTQGNSGPVDQRMLDALSFYNKPLAHDVPCEAVTLAGQNFPLENALTPEPGDMAVTGAYVPFGVTSLPGTVIPGQIPCNGAFFRANPDGTDLQLIAWGLRASFGYRFSASGRLIATLSGAEPVPPREVYDDWDTIYEIAPGMWYGWPDYLSGVPAFHPRFQQPGEGEPRTSPPLEFVLTPETHRRLLRGRSLPPAPLVRVASQTGLRGFVFGHSLFGVSPNEILVAASGTALASSEGSVRPRILRVSLATSQTADFLHNASDVPASTAGEGIQAGLVRPVQLEYGPDGALYVVDSGVIDGTAGGPIPRTGAIWRVTRFAGAPPLTPLLPAEASPPMSATPPEPADGPQSDRTADVTPATPSSEPVLEPDSATE